MAEKTKPEGTTPVLLLAAYWPQEDVRVNAGQVFDLPLTEAKRLIAAGKAERADAFPGEA
jgi:hypothetical protein